MQQQSSAIVFIEMSRKSQQIRCMENYEDISVIIQAENEAGQGGKGQRERERNVRDALLMACSTNLCG